MPGDDVTPPTPAPPRSVRPGSALRIVHIYPTVLGLYGDRGNALLLAARAERRGIPTEVISVEPGHPLPDQGDIYLLGGGEDLAQTTAVELLSADKTLANVVARNGVVLAICAGLQILGSEFNAASGPVAGLGLIDATTHAGPTRAVGELLTIGAHGDLGQLTGYENHRGYTRLGPDAEPLGHVVHGVGNGDGTDGVRVGHLIGSYLHGPALARNPALADLVLSWAVGTTLDPLEDPITEALRTERIRAVQSM